MEAQASHRYSTVAIILHWVIAIALLFMIWLGWNMDENEARYQLHKSVGITILVLTVARIGWRIANPPPAIPDTLSDLEKRASHAVHIGFYALLLVLPLSGWLLVSTSYEFDVPTVLYGLISWPDLPFVGFLANETGHGLVQFFHSKMAWVVIALLALHIAGAVKHELSDEEGVLKRMVPRLFGTAAPPEQPPRAALIVLAGAVVPFVLIALTAAIGQNGATQAPADTSETGAAEASDFEPNWAVDFDTSEIRFSGVHDGNEYDGSFRNWTAEIRFAPDAPSDGLAMVSVRTGTAVASKKLYTDSLKAPEWFDISNHPIAMARLDTMRAEPGGGYSAELHLTIKAQTVTVPFAFDLEDTDDGKRMTGSTTLSRRALNLGQESDPGADWVDDEVTVDVVVNASPLD